MRLVAAALCWWLLAALPQTRAASCQLPENPEATLVALLRLHHGTNCSRVALRGLQQQAALAAAVDAVNGDAPAGSLKMAVRVFDICSDPEDAVKATLRALVASEKTCLRPPQFLGFVGPMDAASLSAVQKVTRVFDLPHVVPFGEESSSAIPVTFARQQSKVQEVLSVIGQLGARSILVLRAADPTAAHQAEELVPAAKAASICVVRPPAQLPPTPASTSLDDVSNGTLVVVLAGEAEEAALDWVPSRLPVLVVSRSAGVLASAGAAAAGRHDSGAPLLVLVDVSEPGVLHDDTWRQKMRALPLFADYLHQLGGAENDGGAVQVGDASLLPLTYSVSLFAAATRAAQAARCRGTNAPCAELLALSQKEWRGSLGAVTGFARHTTAPARRLRFHMELAAVSELYAWDHQQAALKKVGHLTSGKPLAVSDQSALSVAQLSSAQASGQCYGQVVAEPAAPAPSAPQPQPPAVAAGASVTVPATGQTATTTEEDPMATLLGDGYTYEQMVGVLAGVGVGMLAFFSLCVYVVYSSFRVSSDKSDRQSNGSDSPRRGSSRRCRRRSSFTPRSSRRGSD